MRAHCVWMQRSLITAAHRDGGEHIVEAQRSHFNGPVEQQRDQWPYWGIPWGASPLLCHVCSNGQHCGLRNETQLASSGAGIHDTEVPCGKECIGKPGIILVRCETSHQIDAAHRYERSPTVLCSSECF
jgi:hypothetical protein